MSKRITMGVLREAMDILDTTKSPNYIGLMVYEDFFDDVREEVKPAIKPEISLFGLDIYKKEGQVVPAYIIADKELMYDYLMGKVSELQLLEVARDSKKVVSILP